MLLTICWARYTILFTRGSAHNCERVQQTKERWLKNMTFDAIYNIALEVANARAQSGERVAPGDTICVMISRTGRVYNGVSHTEMMNGKQVSVHAEIDAMLNMQTYGNEVSVDSMVLIDAMTRSPMLPCAGCLEHIISKSPENSAGCIVMPDRIIPIGELMGAQNSAFSGMPAGMPSAAPVQSGYFQSMPFGAAPVQSGYVQSMQFGAAPVQSSNLQSMTSSQVADGAGSGGTSKNDLLKNRVSSLLSAAETDEEEDEEFLEELTSKKKKKGLFGLFG